MGTQSRVVFIIPYIGKWPRWARLFFDSCATNNVSVVIDCDHIPPFDLPPNVHVNKITRNELITRIRSTLNIDITSLTGHQICNFRPFFGHIYKEYIKDYEFWGYCDVDMMFGDLDKLFTDEFLDSIDVFSAHTWQTVGHFTILKNTDSINDACFEIEHWQTDCLEQIAPAMVDEIGFAKVINARKHLRIARPENFDKEIQREFCRFGVNFNFTGNIAYSDAQDLYLARWHNGNVYLEGKEGFRVEALYVHFMGTKRWWHWLFATRKSLESNQHVLSRIGYGGIEHPGQLEKLPWSFLYYLQLTFFKSKAKTGKLMRNTFSPRLFLYMRRLIFGKGRY